LLRQPVISSPIIGANSAEQLSDNLAAIDLKLNDEQVDRLNEASKWQ
jgi:aryl-alcohol dehydrogenase-like predicted oxidoreductase